MIRERGEKGGEEKEKEKERSRREGGDERGGVKKKLGRRRGKVGPLQAYRHIRT